MSFIVGTGDASQGQRFACLPQCAFRVLRRGVKRVAARSPEQFRDTSSRSEARAVPIGSSAASNVQQMSRYLKKDPVNIYIPVVEDLADAAARVSAMRLTRCVQDLSTPRSADWI